MRSRHREPPTIEVRLLAAAIALALAAAAPLAPRGSADAQAAGNEKGAKKGSQIVRFKHKGCSAAGSECRAAYALDLDDGEQFAIEIDSTLPDDFRYDVAGVPAAPSGRAAPQAAEYRDTTFTQRHDKRYGGYIVTIRRKGRAAALPEATLIVSARTTEWQAAFAGGFPISTLTDRAYALRDSTVGSTKEYLVQRERDHEDKVALATATFVHLRRTSWRLESWGTDWGLSFGLGIGGNTTYYVGPSLLFGSAGAFSFGAVFGSRNDLPGGINVDQLTTNANALSTPAKRNAVGFFAGFSYSFLGGGASDLQKPFKGTESGGGEASPASPPSPSTQPSSAATGTVSVSPSSPKVDQQVTFTVTLNRAQGAAALTDRAYGVEPATQDDAERFSLSAATVTLKAVQGGAKAQGEVKAKVLTAVNAMPLSLRLTAGSDTTVVTSAPVTVSPE